MRPRTLGAVLLCVAACDRAGSPAKDNSVSSRRAEPPPAESVAGAPQPKPWDDDLGRVIATPSLDSGTPVSFSPDTGGTAGVAVELFSHDDHATNAILHTGTPIRACAWRRTASVTAGDARVAPNGWALALSPGVATPVGVGDVDALSPRDSAATVARISLLVSGIPEDSTSAPYHGLPIVVRDAWQFRLADSTRVAVAIATRSLNVESNPRMQAITLIAEPDPASASGQWRAVYWERVAGPEDRVEGMDLLAALELRDTTAAVALAREGDAGLQVEIVQRRSPGTWAVRWSSARIPCASP